MDYILSGCYYAVGRWRMSLVSTSTVGHTRPIGTLIAIVAIFDELFNNKQHCKVLFTYLIKLSV